MCLCVCVDMYKLYLVHILNYVYRYAARRMLLVLIEGSDSSR